MEKKVLNIEERKEAELRGYKKENIISSHWFVVCVIVLLSVLSVPMALHGQGGLSFSCCVIFAFLSAVSFRRDTVSLYSNGKQVYYVEDRRYKRGVRAELKNAKDVIYAMATDDEISKFRKDGKVCIIISSFLLFCFVISLFV